MHDHVTLLRPEPREADPRGMSSALPADFVEQIRLRVRVLAVLILIPFAFDPLLFAGNWLVASLRGVPLPREVASTAPFQWVNLAAVTASAALWAIARSRRVSASRLLVAGVVYEIAICFVIATISIWQHFLDRGYVPTLTWVPVIVILFPLVLPGPPRRVLWGSIAAGAMAPLALFLLDVFDTVAPRPEAYAQTIISSVFAVGFAYMGARVVYGLGREVVAARALGSYQLEERLGQGGMGEVWRARHRLLARPAAIKVIKPSLIADSRTAASADVFRRFEREAQITARLRSPHTVELFDFGVADDGAFYYVMELLDGLDVDRLVRASGPIAAERAVYILRQVCHSLSEAQSCDLVHRDIKPANIFLCRYGEDYDFVKVLDFGIAKAASRDLAAAATGPVLTRDNVVRGTPAFIAPEQAMGAALDARADIYATGCVAYWLLTGELVFTGDTPIGILMQHVTAPPMAPSARTELPIPAALDELVLSCLAKDPAARPQSARELARRLADVQCRDVWTEDRAKAWWAAYRPEDARPSAHA
jgi:eukaryotic-like serine/threonine-protein kinase